MTVSVTTTRMPSAAIARRHARVAAVEDEDVDQPAVEARDAARRHLEPEPAQHAVERALDRPPADQRRSTADRARAPARAARARTPGTARIGPIETSGFDGAMTIASLAPERGQHAGRRARAARAPASSMRRTRPRPRRRTR